MDDIRRPQRMERRDYSLDPRRPASGGPMPPRPHAQPHPGHQAPHQPHPGHQTQPHPGHQVPPRPQHPDYQPNPYRPQPPQPAQPQYNHQPYPHHQPAHHPQQHRPQPQPAAAPQAVPAKTRKIFAFKSIFILVIVILAGGLFALGYFLKGSSASDGIPAKITKQANYDLYFPSPMPAGYTYMKDTATFQIGQVYYKFSDGRKRVTVKEEPIADTKPNLNLLAGFTQFDSPIGKAAIGTSVGQPTAVIVTNTTVITMNTFGGVSQNDLRTAINNLKNIGQPSSHN